jgi:hypothetical protein
MDKNILDDLDWEKDDNNEDDDKHDEVDSEVILLKTFNTEEQANLYCLALNNEGINAQVISSAASQLTPFDYGNHRLYVSEAQLDDAQYILKVLEKENNVYETPKWTAARILITIILGLFITGIAIAALRVILEGFYLR